MGNRPEQITAHAVQSALAEADRRYAPKPPPPSNGEAMNSARRAVAVAKARKAIALLPQDQQDVFLSIMQLIGA